MKGKSSSCSTLVNTILISLSNIDLLKSLKVKLEQYPHLKIPLKV